MSTTNLVEAVYIKEELVDPDEENSNIFQSLDNVNGTQPLQSFNSNSKNNVSVDSTEDESYSSKVYSRKHIDVRALIKEVAKRSELWDPNSDVYKDRNKKLQAWSEVCQTVYEDYKEMDEVEKAIFGKEIQNKWKNVRDSYQRYRKRQRDPNQFAPGVKRSRDYVYHKMLTFLNVVDEKKETTPIPTPSIEIEPERSALKLGNKYVPIAPMAPISTSSGRADHSPSIINQTLVKKDNLRAYIPSPPRAKKKKKKHADPLEENLIAFLKNMKEQESDSDQLFLLSLLPDIKSFDNDQKTLFKMKALQYVQEVRNLTNFTNANAHLLPFNQNLSGTEPTLNNPGTSNSSNTPSPVEPEINLFEL